MKKIKLLLPYLLIVGMLLALLPAVHKRVSQEQQNNNIVMSVYYNDLYNKVSPQKQKKLLSAYKKEGITLMSVSEEDVNSMVAKGAFTCIKLNVLKHKYDQESIDLAKYIESNYPQLNFDCYLLITKDDAVKKKLAAWIPAKYTDAEFLKLESFGDIDVYAYTDGREDLWNISLGYDEETIAELKSQGFDIALIHKVKHYQKTDYLAYIESLIKKYDIRYFNIKEDGAKFNENNPNKKNATELANILVKNKLTLLVTENPDHLSNQKCLGYKQIFEQVMEKGSQKVLRSFETYDDSQSNKTFYSHRVEQFFNSTIDRNIRFIMITQLTSDGEDFETLSELTLRAAQEYKKKILAVGYTVNEEPASFDYTASHKLNAALAAVIMVMMLLLMIETVFHLQGKFTRIALIVALVAFAGTFVLPDALLSLYATAFAGLLPCFAMTMVFLFVQKQIHKFPTLLCILFAVLMAVGIMSLGGLVTGSLLSGLPYYINNSIFRGIKITLLIPTIYSAIAFYIMFIHNTMFTQNKKIKDFIPTVQKLLKADIKVYWVLLALLIGAVGRYYIIRSGNVNTISSIEKALRTAVTEAFPQRPRTKEFILGYPAFVLFIYYMKNTNLKLIQWLFAVAGSILVASISNSFCHVFTNLGTIYMRVVYGIFLGALVSLLAYIANLVLVAIVKKIVVKIKNRG